MIKTTIKKMFAIICLTQIICTANIETNLSSLTFKIVEDLTNLMFDDKPNIDNLKNILEDLINIVCVIGDQQDQTGAVKTRLTEITNEIKKKLNLIKNNPTKDIDEKEKTNLEVPTKEQEDKVLQDQEKKLMVQGFKEILSSLFGMMINPYAVVLYSEKLISGILKIISSIFADGKIDYHDLENIQTSIKEVLSNKK